MEKHFVQTKLLNMITVKCCLYVLIWQIRLYVYFLFLNKNKCFHAGVSGYVYVHKKKIYIFWFSATTTSQYLSSHPDYIKYKYICLFECMLSEYFGVVDHQVDKMHSIVNMWWARFTIFWYFIRPNDSSRTRPAH